jgi:uncharacterized protein (UPF0335 family)
MEQYRLDLLNEACDLYTDIKACIDSHGNFFEDHEMLEKEARLDHLISQMNLREMKGYTLVTKGVIQTTIKLRWQNRQSKIEFDELVSEYRDAIGVLIGKA